MGFGNSFSVESMAASALASARFCFFENVAIFSIHFRSAPAQKLAPAPSSTTARTAASAPSARSACVSSAISVSLNALWTSGRLRVTSAIVLRTETSMVLYPSIAAGLPLRRLACFLAVVFPLMVYIRKTPNVVGSMGLFNAAEIASPRIFRVSAGSMTPSSQIRALA